MTAQKPDATQVNCFVLSEIYLASSLNYRSVKNIFILQKQQKKTVM